MHTDAMYLRRIPLPSMSQRLLAQIVDLVSSLEQESYMSANWFSYMKSLDAVVYNAFNLDDAEREYVDSEMKFVQSNKWF